MRQDTAPSSCSAPRPRVIAQELRKRLLGHRASSKRKDSLRRVLFGGGKAKAVDLKKEDADHEAGALTAIDKRMVADDSKRVGGGQDDDVVGLTHLLREDRIVRRELIAAVGRFNQVKRLPLSCMQAVVKRDLGSTVG